MTALTEVKKEKVIDLRRLDMNVTRIHGAYGVTTQGWSRARPLPRPLDGLVLFMQGSITYQFGTGAQTATPGDVLIFPKGLVYSGQKRTESNSYMVIDFETDAALPLSALELPYVVPSDDETVRLFRECVAAWGSGHAEAEMECKALVYRLAARLCRLVRRESAPAAPAEQAAEYLHRHYTEPELSIEKMSDELHISASQLRRRFMQAYGVSPLRYAQSLRLEFAKNLLMNEHLPVAEAAARAGFASEFYFSRFFRERMGVTPGAYRSGAAETVKKFGETAE